jgi:hypothetical protein
VEILLSILTIAWLLSFIGILKPYIKGANRAHFAGAFAITFVTAGVIGAGDLRDKAPSGVGTYSPDHPAVWSSAGCALQITFPGKPRIKSSEVPGVGRFETAELGIGAEVYRADCTPIPEEQKALWSQDVDRRLRETLTLNAERSGVWPVEITSLGSRVAQSRGNKRIGDIEMTYILRVAEKDGTLMSAMIASQASQFPAPSQIAFLDSLRPR